MSYTGFIAKKVMFLFLELLFLRNARGNTPSS